MHNAIEVVEQKYYKNADPCQEEHFNTALSRVPIPEGDKPHNFIFNLAYALAEEQR